MGEVIATAAVMAASCATQRQGVIVIYKDWGQYLRLLVDMSTHRGFVYRYYDYVYYSYLVVK
jgi:hypothetical protein